MQNVGLKSTNNRLDIIIRTVMEFVFFKKKYNNNDFQKYNVTDDLN